MLSVSGSPCPHVHCTSIPMTMNYVFRVRMAIAAALIALPALAGSAVAQTSYDEQAKAILKLYDAGQKDSAYALIEPLKRRARFAPAVLYTRARLTQDDRALPLLKEVIALDPTGAWADEAAYQLVRRYAEKSDSSAAYTWSNVLRTNYPHSSYIQSASDLLASVKNWELNADDVAERGTTKVGTVARESQKGATAVTAEKTVAKGATPVVKAEKATAKSEVVSGDAEKSAGTEKAAGLEKTVVAEKPTAAQKAKTATDEKTVKKTTTQPAETYHATGMKGYALQVGVFPTRKAADAQLALLKKKNIRSTVLPKMVKGKKEFAVVVGQYQTIEDATKKKSTVASACNCQTFLVKID